MSYVDVPDVGRFWQCGSCLKWLETDSGDIYEWSDPLTAQVATVPEIRMASRNPCPECGKSMLEVMMEGFGSRWQCGSCRLTVYSSGGIQRWGPPKQAE
jgi:ribosomal protein S27AE